MPKINTPIPKLTEKEKKVLEVLKSRDVKAQNDLFRKDIEAFCEYVLGLYEKDHQQLELLWNICNLVNAKVAVHTRKRLKEKIKRLENEIKSTNYNMRRKEELKETKERLKNHVVTPEQEELAIKIGISVDAARGVGKTYGMAAAIYWFLINYPAKIIATAPKQDLLRDNLWGNLHAIKRKSIEKNGKGSLLDIALTIMADKIEIKNHKENFCVARTASRNAKESEQKATISGYHDDFMMIVCDESYGIPDKVYEPLDDTLTGPVNIIVLIGNPTKNHGFAADTWGKHKKYWINMCMSAEKSIFVDESSSKRLKEKYADDPNGYRINVLGLKPIDSSDSLIPYSAITRCIDMELPEETYKHEPAVFGCDIGGGSDLTVVTMRKGMYVEVIGTYNSRDTYEIAEWISGLIETYRPVKVGVDGIGIGAGTYNDLKHLGYKDITYFIDSRSTKNINKEKFLNKRAELYWKLREKIIGGQLCLPDHEQLKSELSILKLVNEEYNKKIQIISKRELKKEGQKSPNYADSLMICEAFDLNRIRVANEVAKDKYERELQKTNERSWMSA